MRNKKRLERLEKAYFSELKRGQFHHYELLFWVAFGSKYEGHEDSAPLILRHAYELVERRQGNRRSPG